MAINENSTENTDADELESLRRVARLARYIFEPTEGEYSSILLNALLCTREDIDELSWSLEQERKDTVRGQSPFVAYQRIAKRIDLAVALDEHQDEFGESQAHDEAVSS